MRYLTRQPKTPFTRRPGPRSQGIRSGYLRTEVYLAPAVRAGLDRLAERREVHTGKKTRRSNVIREALLEYLQKHLPESEV